MNDKKLVLKKGYTLEVTSWENDADNYRTQSMTFNDKDVALAVLDMCKSIFVSCNNGVGGIGNMMDDEYELASPIMLEYMKNHPKVCESFDPEKWSFDKTKDEDLVGMCSELNYALMGGSEYYYSRVFESGVITYSPEDVYCEIVQ